MYIRACLQVKSPIKTSRQNHDPRNLQGIFDGKRRPLTQMLSSPCNCNHGQSRPGIKSLNA